MTDIVERLRSKDTEVMLLTGGPELTLTLSTWHEAADEIERLREALLQIAHAPNGKVYCADGHEECVLIARAALGEKE